MLQASPGSGVLELPQRDRCYVPEGLDIHMILDNYVTHKTPKIKAWLARRPHYHVHFTPASASWINQVERWFAELTRKRLQRGVHTSVRLLEADIRSFIDQRNQNPRPFKWTKWRTSSRNECAGYSVSSSSTQNLKLGIRDIETDRRLHRWLLRIMGASTAPTSMALTRQWRSRPQHQNMDIWYPRCAGENTKGDRCAHCRLVRGRATIPELTPKFSLFEAHPVAWCGDDYVNFIKGQHLRTRPRDPRLQHKVGVVRGLSFAIRVVVRHQGQLMDVQTGSVPCPANPQRALQTKT